MNGAHTPKFFKASFATNPNDTLNLGIQNLSTGTRLFGMWRSMNPESEQVYLPMLTARLWHSGERNTWTSCVGVYRTCMEVSEP